MGRFSIAGLMAVVLVCGVAVAALRDASDTWAGVMLAVTLFMLGVALIGVLTRRGDRRAYWQGFALFGWGYLILTMAPWASEQVGPRLPTTHLLGYAHGLLNPAPKSVDPFDYLDVVRNGVSLRRSPANPPRNSRVRAYTAKPSPPPRPVGNATVGRPAKPFVFFLSGGKLDQFVRVGHCLFALLVALVGGLIARWFRRTDREPGV